MKVYHHLNEFKSLSNAVVTIGTFDGVHFGHKKIIKKLVEDARKLHAESVVLTFFPHPRMIIQPEDDSLKMINTMAEKTQLLAEIGVDHLIITPFTRDFSNLSAQEYIETILHQTIGIQKIIIGYDHRFGKNREGTLSHLMKWGEVYGYTVEEIPEQDINDVAVSSTRIREALLKGDVDTAKTYLGYPFPISGQVIKGDKIGRTIGFPTANIFLKENYKLIPVDGVYAVSVDVPCKHGEIKTFKAMSYIGKRPTINGMTRNIEVNIFDFSEEIYGQTITVHFEHHLRNDMKFNGLEELKNQLKQDQQNTITYFKTQDTV